MPQIGKDEFVRIRMAGGAGSYILAPVLTTTQRDALTAEEGMVIFNSTTDQLEEYDGATWEAVGQVILTTHTADLDAHTKNTLEVLRTGGYWVSQGGYQGTLALTANRLYGLLCVVPRSITVDRIAYEVTTAGGAGTKARLGIYSLGTNLAPGALLLDAGEVVADATGVKASTISQALVKGIYYLAVVSDGTPTIRTIADSPAVGYPALGFDSTNFGKPYKGFYAAHTYAALPDPFPTPTIYNYGVGVLVRVLSLD